MIGEHYDIETTLQNRLLNIDEAIKKIESGAQEYRIGTRTLRRADLSVLYKERRQLQYELTLAQQRGGGMSVATFTRD